ncbi:unnamed protein product, partial [marine sediment metagenome]
QFGSELKDSSQVFAKDSQDNLYIAGYTYGSLDGYTNQGSIDVAVSKLTSDGQIVWIRQLGTSAADAIRGMAIGDDGSVYLGGSISSNGVVIKLDSNGDEVWRDIIDPGSPSVYGQSIAIGNDGAGQFLAFV